MSKASTLSAILSGDDAEIVGWHIDGIRQETMAEWLGVSLPTVKRRIALIRQTLAKYGLSLPDSPYSDVDTRHVRAHDPSRYQLN